MALSIAGAATAQVPTIDRSCDTQTCAIVRLDDSPASGGNSFNVLDTIAGSGAAGISPDALKWGPHVVWTSGQDGAGSTLDADTLDGVDSASFASASHLHDDRYFVKSELQGSGTINAVGNPVHWTRLAGVPTGLADGTDADTTYTAGSGLTLVGGQFAIADSGVTGAKVLDGTIQVPDLAYDPATQAELDGHKTGADHDARYAARSELQNAGTINAAGNPVHWTRLQGVPAGIADGTDADSGGDVTSVVAGTGLSGGGIAGDVTLSANTNVLQARVTGSCTTGSTVRAVNADGSVVCDSKAADADRLDGLDSTKFLRADASGTLNGNLAVTGTITAYNGIRMSGTVDVATNGAPQGYATIDISGLGFGDSNYRIMLTARASDAGGGPDGHGPLYVPFWTAKSPTSFTIIVYDIQAGAFNVVIPVDYVIVR